MCLCLFLFVNVQKFGFGFFFLDTVARKVPISWMRDRNRAVKIDETVMERCSYSFLIYVLISNALQFIKIQVGMQVRQTYI